MSLFNVFKKTTPCDYVVFDFETSGLNVRSCEVLEIGALKVYNDKIIDSFSTLIRPQFAVDPAALKVNNLQMDELMTAPHAYQVFDKFFDFISDNKLVGYNINTFDVPILQRYAAPFNIELSNDTDDALPLARRKLSGLPNYKLSTVAAYFQLDTSSAHRALADCQITQACYSALLQLPDIVEKPKPKSSSPCYHTRHRADTNALIQLKSMLMGILDDNVIEDREVIALNEWLDRNQYLAGEYPYDRVFFIVKKALADGMLTADEKNEIKAIFEEVSSHDICDKCEDHIQITDKAFVLTGDFDYGERSAVQEFIESHGGICKAAVSSKVDYVIVGNLGSPSWGFGDYGSKVKKAKELQEKGKSIMIISETDFFK